MKANFVCFKLSKTVIILILVIIIQLVFIVIGIKNIRETKSFEQMKEVIIQNKEEKLIESPNIEMETKENVEEENKLNVEKSETLRKEYETMPSALKGYKVIGKITIAKLKLDTYILEETNKKTLKVSVTKLYGPNINKPGNFCIAGHNYRNNKMFGGIKKLEKGDKIVLTDTYGDSVTYEVYENYQTDPKDVTSLNQETGGEREITLITCTAGAIKRVIVKAVEVYD